MDDEDDDERFHISNIKDAIDQESMNINPNPEFLFNFKLGKGDVSKNNGSFTVSKMAAMNEQLGTEGAKLQVSFFQVKILIHLLIKCLKCFRGKCQFNQ